MFVIIYTEYKMSRVKSIKSKNSDEYEESDIDLEEDSEAGSDVSDSEEDDAEESGEEDELDLPDLDENGSDEEPKDDEDENGSDEEPEDDEDENVSDEEPEEDEPEKLDQKSDKKDTEKQETKETQKKQSKAVETKPKKFLTKEERKTLEDVKKSMPEIVISEEVKEELAQKASTRDETKSTRVSVRTRETRTTKQSSTRELDIVSQIKLDKMLEPNVINIQLKILEKIDKLDMKSIKEMSVEDKLEIIKMISNMIVYGVSYTEEGIGKEANKVYSGIFKGNK